MNSRRRYSRPALLALAVAWMSPDAKAAETNVAVAANFTGPAKEIAAAFQAKTGDTVVLSFGSTGQLYTQITQDAPFTVFLSADDQRPAKAVADGLAVQGSVFTYALGRLALWSADPKLVTGPEVLRAGAFTKLANTNPKVAPYGLAAEQVMTKLGVLDAIKDKLVLGNNLAQTIQFIDTGNAELGFIALSQAVAKTGGSRWLVPAQDHDPIRQDAALLTKGANDPVAKAFLDFLKSAEARAVIERFGYGLAD